jgi:uncharacterized 2Fe-2S/4Fe-4S cluster protein (DUF4445 family)
LAHTSGNGSLFEARTISVSMKCQSQVKEVAFKMIHIDQLVDSDFIEEYSVSLYIPAKSELFPNYRAQKK